MGEQLHVCSCTASAVVVSVVSYASRSFLNKKQPKYMI